MRLRPEFAELLNPRTRRVSHRFLAGPDAGFETDFDERRHGAGELRLDGVAMRYPERTE